jgi:hypothetical protein
MKKLFILNAVTIPDCNSQANGVIEYIRLTPQEAAILIKKNDKEIVSAVGHDSTLKLLNGMWGTDLQLDRSKVSLSIGDSALCLELNSRPDTGRKLLMSDIISIGYSFMLINRLK